MFAPAAVRYTAVMPDRVAARFIEPMLLLKTDALPDDRARWSYQLKLDGYRAIVVKSRGSVSVRSRNNHDFTKRYPSVLPGLAGLPNDTVIDGEIVALDEHGKPSFNLLQGFDNGQAIVLYAFDLLMLRGKDVRLWPLEDRREQLREIIPALPDTIRYSETFNVPFQN